MINNVLNNISDTIDFENKTQTVGYLNIYNYQILRQIPDIVKQINYFTLDGIMLVLFLKLFTKKKVTRQSPDFSSYFKELFSFLNVNKKKVFFVGASNEEIKKFAQIIGLNYPIIEIVGYQSGYDLNIQTVIKQIIEKNTDTLIVGMGTPSQEEFMVKSKLCGYNGSSFVCGAFFSQTASNNGTTYYPDIVSKLHLRWVYRIYKEPKLFKRFLIDYPIGLFYITKDRLGTSSYLL